MTKEKKSEFTLRISQANSASLIVILYEMTITYVQDSIIAEKNNDIPGVKKNAEYAYACINEMLNNLHYEYELAKNLKQIYLYMKKQLRTAMFTGKTDELKTVESELVTLRNAYDSIKETDKSAPLMANTQAVLTGMTYGKDSILNSLTTECSGRGYRV